MKKILLLLSFLLISIGTWGITYKLTQVTSVSSGNKYVLTEGNNVLTGTITNNTIQSTTEFSTSGLIGNELYVWELETAENGFFIKNSNTSKYINNTSSTSITESSDANSNWTFTYSSNYFLIQNYSFNNRFIGRQDGGNGYKAYATSNLSTYSHNFIIYELQEEITETYDITFINKNNGTSVTKQINNGEYTITETVSDYGVWKFSGWSTDSTDFSKIVAKINISNNIELYAFFKSGNDDYILVEEELEDWDGEYLIVNHDSIVAFNGSLATLDAVGDTIHVIISDKAINSTVKNNVSNFTIKSKSGGYSIKSNSGYYIGQTSNSNGLLTSNSDIYTNTISYNGTSIDIKGSGGGYLRYNANIDQNRFRFFRSSTYTSQKEIQLYKRTLANLYCTNPSNIKMIGWLEDSVKLDVINYDSVNVGTNWEKLIKGYDGSYKVHVNNLTNRSCTDLVVKTRKDGRTDCINVFKIPIFITENNATNTDIGSPDSASCDLVILGGAKLTLTDNLENRDVTVYPNGTLNIPSETEYKVNSLTLRRDNDDIPNLSYKGTLDIADKLLFEIRADGTDWRWISLPSAFNVSDLDDPDDEVYIKYYDGAYRAEHLKGAWKDATNDMTFEPGQGFLFGADLPDRIKKSYFIELDPASLEDEKEIYKNDATVKAYGINSGKAANHIGWNIIGNPFFYEYETDLLSPIGLGKMKKDSVDDKWTGGWVAVDGPTSNLKYAVIPSKKQTDEVIAAGGYETVLLDDYTLKPFTAFFVQVGGSDEDPQDVVFNSGNKTDKMRALLTNNNDNEKEVLLRLRINDLKAGCFISNKYSDEYEPGDDIESNYSLYQNIGGYRLLYSAINDSIIENGVVFNSPKGWLTLDPKVDINNFVYIYVTYNDNWFNLLNNDSVFIEEQNSMFILQAKVKKNGVDVPTDIDEYKATNGTYKFIKDNLIFINNRNKIYTIYGSKIK